MDVILCVCSLWILSPPKVGSYGTYCSGSVVVIQRKTCVFVWKFQQGMKQYYIYQEWNLSLHVNGVYYRVLVVCKVEGRYAATALYYGGLIRGVMCVGGIADRQTKNERVRVTSNCTQSTNRPFQGKKTTYTLYKSANWTFYVAHVDRSCTAIPALYTVL